MKITPADEQAPRLGRVLLGTRLVQNDKHEYTKNYYSSTDFPLLLLVRSAFVPALPSTLCCRDHFCVYIFVYRRVSRNKKSFQWGINIHAKIWRCFSPEVECCIWNIFVVIVYGLMFILWCNICSEQMRAAEYLPSGSSVSYVIIGWSLVNGSVSFGPYLQCENTEIVPLSEETTSTVYWCIASKLKAPWIFYWMSNMFLWVEIFLFFVCYHVVPKRHSQLDYELNGLYNKMKLNWYIELKHHECHNWYLGVYFQSRKKNMRLPGNGNYL